MNVSRLATEKRKEKMGTVKVMPTSDMNVVKADKPARKRIFNLDTFEKETKEVDYTYLVVETEDQASTFKGKELVELLNLALKRKALLEAKKSIKGASSTTVSKLLAGFKILPQFAKGNFNDRATQDKAIIDFLKSSPQIFEFVKSQIEASQPDEDEEDDD